MLVLTVTTFCALGILSAVFIVLTKRGAPITIFIAQATGLLGSALFPISLFPAPLEVISKLVPAYYGMRELRAVLLSGAGPASIADELLVLALFVVILLALSPMDPRSCPSHRSSDGDLATS